MNPLTILALCGSLRRQSYNRSALNAAVALGAPQHIVIEPFDIAGIPGFSEDDEKNPPPKVIELKAKIRAANAILFVTPEYNYSVPGVLKNAIDWASRPYGDNAWAGKPAGIMGASVGSMGTARAQYHLRQICVFLDVHVMNKPEIMITSASTKFDAAGNLTDDSTREHLRKFVTALAAWASRFSSN